MYYDDLIIAIVKQAANDYRRCRKHINEFKYKERISEIERFFMSDWCKMLTPNGEYILTKLKEEI